MQNKMISILSIESMSEKVIKMIPGHQYDFVTGNVSDLKDSVNSCCLYFDTAFQDGTSNHTFASLIEYGILRQHEKIVCKKSIYIKKNATERDYIYITDLCNLFIPSFTPNGTTFGVIHCGNLTGTNTVYLHMDIYNLLIKNDIYNYIIENKRIQNTIPYILYTLNTRERETYGDIIKTVDMINNIGLSYNSTISYYYKQQDDINKLIEENTKLQMFFDKTMATGFMNEILNKDIEVINDDPENRTRYSLPALQKMKLN